MGDVILPVLTLIGVTVAGALWLGISTPPFRRLALAAHRVTHGEPLRDLPSLRPGDTVLVETHNAVYTYEIDTDPNQLVVGLDEVWVLAAQPVNPHATGVQPGDGRRLLTLVTCAELFHTDDRMVAFGHLVARQPR